MPWRQSKDESSTRDLYDIILSQGVKLNKCEKNKTPLISFTCNFLHIYIWEKEKRKKERKNRTLGSTETINGKNLGP